ncbi:MAG: protein kinase, partial [Chitinophagaceae bacterium]|nr:protein kinase [Chitinophagaceae bacterium]
MIGASFGRYRIDHQLGEGGMAIVYKAFDAHLETYVALKVIRRDWLLLEGKDALLARFEAEAKRVARLSHPNIIPILDYGQYDDAPYLVMKFIPGGTLKERLGSPMPWREAARLLSPVARALS